MYEPYGSTFEDEAPVPTSIVCVVYDERDGRIVHSHEFVGDGAGLFGPEGDDERSGKALAIAKQHAEPTRVQTLHLPSDFRLDRDKTYRVDVASREIVTTRSRRPSFRELIERRRND